MYRVALGSKNPKIPSEDEFRKVGYTSYAANFPLTWEQQLWLAAFNGVPVDKMPDAWRYAPNETVYKQYEKRICKER